MRHAGGRIGLVFDDGVALRADVIDHAAGGHFGRDALDQPDVDARGGGGGDDVARARAGARARHAAHVERRVVQQLDQAAAAAFRAAERELAAEVGVYRRGFGDGALFGLAQGLDAVVEVRDGSAAVVIPHAGEQAGEHERGVGRPVAVVAAVQLVAGAVDREIERDNTARAEDDLGAAALVHRTVADQPDVAGQQVLVRGNDLGQVRRAGLLFTLEEEFQIRARRDVGGVEDVERGGDGDNGRFVVGGGAGVEAPFGVDRSFGGKPDHAAVLFERPVAQHRLPRRRSPFPGVERLAVIVGVKDDGAGGAGRGDFAVNGRRSAGYFEETRADAAAAEEGGNGIGVAADRG